MIALPLVLAFTPTIAELPAAWAGDGGSPVAYGDSTIYLYGDTIRPGNFVQGTTVLVGDDVISNALTPTDDTFYWPDDAFEMPDGRLFVVASEVRSHGTGVFDFAGVDHDAFIVDDPLNAADWRWADKIEVGPWGNDAVEFSDQAPLAVTYAANHGSLLWEYNPAAPWEPWIDYHEDFPESHGTFMPVSTGHGEWWGVTWAIWGTMPESDGTVAALWRADSGDGPFEWVRTLPDTGMSYNHGLNVIDGDVVWRYSTLNGRVTYEGIDLEDS